MDEREHEHEHPQVHEHEHDPPHEHEGEGEHEPDRVQIRDREPSPPSPAAPNSATSSQPLVHPVIGPHDYGPYPRVVQPSISIQRPPPLNLRDAGPSAGLGLRPRSGQPERHTSFGPHEKWDEKDRDPESRFVRDKSNRSCFQITVVLLARLLCGGGDDDDDDDDVVWKDELRNNGLGSKSVRFDWFRFMILLYLSYLGY